MDFEMILKNKAINTMFQPIVSIRKKQIIGLEALSRGFVDNETISPLVLFQNAKQQGRMLELDRLCRTKAMEEYSRIYGDSESLLLFINVDASILSKGVVGSGNLFRSVTKYNLNPANIAIEINESKLNDTDSLKEFVNIYRKRNFLIALDDVGAGHSNLNRIALVKPDIIKLDMSLVRDIDKEFYKQEVVSSLTCMANSIGCLVVAEGIEKYEEAQCLLKCDVDMLQGYYFSVPVNAEKVSFQSIETKVKYVASKFRNDEKKNLQAERYHKHEYSLMIQKMILKLKGSSCNEFDNILDDMINLDSRIECLYILDNNGVQASRTICNFHRFKKVKSAIFKPASKGTDHSLKTYYYLLKGTGRKRYITEPYISCASGNICITLSSVFKDSQNKKFYLCADANYVQKKYGNMDH